ncbi:hypothetical protein N7G274_004206 [Stereocaulon virgatum]|uniref:Uncharacterized protein n=1 Tax=Stereocaulon virgatum TaxID=373712 RepID=A0ABR4AE91_9LECA
MLAYTLIAVLVPILAYSQANPLPPQCTVPPPPASQLPDLADCLKVQSAIVDIAVREGNQPQVWARRPRAPHHDYWLPHAFSSDALNNCDLVADGPAWKLDIFPTKYMASAAAELIRECLIGTSPQSATLGEVVVGSRRVIKLTLRRKMRPLMPMENELGNVTVKLNRTGDVRSQIVQDGPASLTGTE